MKITTFHPSIKKRKRKHGFRKRKLTKYGRNVLLRRKRKKRERLIP